MEPLRPPRQLRRPPRGYTLAEVLLTVTITGLALALAIPRLRTDKRQVDTAVREATMAFLRAQREAVVRQHNVLLVFDTAGRTLQTVMDANNNARIDANERVSVVPLPDQVLLQRPAGVPAVPGDTTGVGQMGGITRGPSLVLQRNGSANLGVTVYLTTRPSLTAADKDVRAVRVQRATGQPSWFAWTGTRWRPG